MRVEKTKIKLIQILCFACICALVPKVQASVSQHKKNNDSVSSVLIEPLLVDTNFNNSVKSNTSQNNEREVRRRGLLLPPKNTNNQIIKRNPKRPKNEKGFNVDHIKDGVVVLVNKTTSMVIGIASVYGAVNYFPDGKQWVIEGLRFTNELAFEAWKSNYYSGSMLQIAVIGAGGVIAKAAWDQWRIPVPSPDNVDNKDDNNSSSKTSPDNGGDNNSSSRRGPDDKGDDDAEPKKPNQPHLPVQHEISSPPTFRDAVSPILPAFLAMMAGGSYVTFPAYYISARMGGEIMLFFISQLEKWPTSKILRSFQRNVGGRPYLLRAPDAPASVYSNVEEEPDPNNIVQKVIHSIFYYQAKLIALTSDNKESLYWFAMSCCATLLFFLIDFLTPEEQNFHARIQTNNVIQTLKTFSKEEIKQMESQEKMQYSKMMAIFLFFLTLLFTFSFFLDRRKKPRKY